LLFGEGGNFLTALSNISESANDGEKRLATSLIKVILRMQAIIKSLYGNVHLGD